MNLSGWKKFTIVTALLFPGATFAASLESIVAVQQAQINKLQEEMKALKPRIYRQPVNIVAADPTANSITAAPGSTLTIQKQGSMCHAIGFIKIASLQGAVYALGIDVADPQFRPSSTRSWGAAINAAWPDAGGTQFYMIYSAETGRIHVYRNDMRTPVSFTSGSELHFTYTYICG